MFLQFAVKSVPRLVIFGTGLACSLPAAVVVSVITVGTAVVAGYIIRELTE